MAVIRRLMAVVSSVALAIAACGGDDSNSVAGPSATTAARTTPVEATQTAASADEGSGTAGDASDGGSDAATTMVPPSAGTTPTQDPVPAQPSVQPPTASPEGSDQTYSTDGYPPTFMTAPPAAETSATGETQFWTHDGTTPAAIQSCVGVLGFCLGQPVDDAIQRLGSPQWSQAEGNGPGAGTTNRWDLEGGGVRLGADATGRIRDGGVFSTGSLKAALPDGFVLGETTPALLTATGEADKVEVTPGQGGLGRSYMYIYCRGPQDLVAVGFVLTSVPEVAGTVDPEVDVGDLAFDSWFFDGRDILGDCRA